MTRDQLEHIIRAAAVIANDDVIVVIGSQSILGQFPTAPSELLISNEADVYPRSHPERSDLIDGTIGEGSPFHETFGYYAQGVDETTAVLPAGWESRLIPICNPATRGATGLCLEVHDLVISKYVADRPKDQDYVRSALRHGLVERDLLLERLSQTPLSAEVRLRLERRIDADANRA